MLKFINITSPQGGDYEQTPKKKKIEPAPPQTNGMEKILEPLLQILTIVKVNPTQHALNL
jgi:hypothetical protein